MPKGAARKKVAKTTKKRRFKPKSPKIFLQESDFLKFCSKIHAKMVYLPLLLYYCTAAKINVAAFLKYC